MGHGSSKETNSTPSSRTSRFRNWLCHPHRHLMHRLSRHGSSGSSVNTFAEDFAGIALLTLRSQFKISIITESARPLSHALKRKMNLSSINVCVRRISYGKIHSIGRSRGGGEAEGGSKQVEAELQGALANLERQKDETT
ncbi:hypothetical protein CRG98_041009 [Punica granatum]|uniref:Uncharacterized protein n=1 Tax=Punica granatum TaxID=22663 RepID=A0A2I0I576_PUNGR|nr:hypothetical protein CRG98_041009 [Punica granatum]